MTGFLAVLAGGKPVLPLSVVASNVKRVERGSTPDGEVTSVALPNTAITGGVGPFTQAWTRLSGGTPTVSDATALNPTWTETVTGGVPSVSSWQVTVTDALSATASFTISVTLTWEQA
jgi:hypothetical protein